MRARIPSHTHTHTHTHTHKTLVAQGIFTPSFISVCSAPVIDHQISIGVDTVRDTPSIAFQHLPCRKDVVNQCLECVCVCVNNIVCRWTQPCSLTTSRNRISVPWTTTYIIQVHDLSPQRLAMTQVLTHIRCDVK